MVCLCIPRENGPFVVFVCEYEGGCLCWLVGVNGIDHNLQEPGDIAAVMKSHAKAITFGLELTRSCMNLWILLCA